MYKQKYNNKNLQKHSKQHKKFNTELCDNDMTFQECELAILRHAVDETDKIQGQKKANSEEIQKILKIVEQFIIDKHLICYGGTAINNILPKNAQFYNREVEIPDYDFFSPNALDDAKELADIYYNAGYIDVEAKSGVHMGTFKVFVNFIPIADITYMHEDLYKALDTESIQIAGILYAPPNYLRMAMYLELSRPAGDVSRWEKVMKRLNLLNDHYPLVTNNKCYKMDFDKGINGSNGTTLTEKIYTIIRDAFIHQGVIFFGGYAMSQYLKYSSNHNQSANAKNPVFDVLSEESERCATIIVEQLTREGIKNAKIIKHPEFYEIIPEHYEIRVGKQTMAFIYKPIACHSYNTININGNTVNIATIDTILTFYLSFIYVNRPYYNKDRLLCMANLLFEIEQQNRLEQHGILKRFSINCYGKQQTLEDIRAEKAQKYEELKRDRKSREYEMWFLKYVPDKIKSKHPITKLLSSTSGDEREHEVDADEETQYDAEEKQYENKEKQYNAQYEEKQHENRKNQYKKQQYYQKPLLKKHKKRNTAKRYRNKEKYEDEPTLLSSFFNINNKTNNKTNKTRKTDKNSKSEFLF